MDCNGFESKHADTAPAIRMHRPSANETQSLTPLNGGWIDVFVSVTIPRYMLIFVTQYSNHPSQLLPRARLLLVSPITRNKQVVFGATELQIELNTAQVVKVSLQLRIARRSKIEDRLAALFSQQQLPLLLQSALPACICSLA